MLRWCLPVRLTIHVARLGGNRGGLSIGLPSRLVLLTCHVDRFQGSGPMLPDGEAADFTFP